VSSPETIEVPARTLTLLKYPSCIIRLRATIYFWEGCLLHVLNEIRSRNKVLQGIWKPIGLLASAVSFIGFVKEFHHRTGRFFPGSILLLVVSVGLLYTIPSKSIRLLATRFVAFVLDLGILALFTYAVGDLLFRYHTVRPSGLLSAGLDMGLVSGFRSL